jgi:hypothetical protein
VHGGSWPRLTKSQAQPTGSERCALGRGPPCLVLAALTVIPQSTAQIAARAGRGEAGIAMFAGLIASQENDGAHPRPIKLVHSHV